MRKMMEWTEDMIRFMNDASSYSDYFEFLAEALNPYIEKSNYVCDAGCGLGHLSLSLSSYCKEVVGIDINSNAIQQLNRSISKLGLSNVSSLVADLNTFAPSTKFDLMIFNYFGSMEQIIQIKDRCCLGKAIVVKRNYKNHRFSIGENPITSFTGDTAVDFLIKNRIPYQEKIFSHEFGQPFRNLDDAVEFFKLYSRDENPNLVNQDSVKERLEKTENEIFPYYLKNRKESRILVI